MNETKDGYYEQQIKRAERDAMYSMAAVAKTNLYAAKHESHDAYMREHVASILIEAQLQTQYQERIAIALERIANRG